MCEGVEILREWGVFKPASKIKGRVDLVVEWAIEEVMEAFREVGGLPAVHSMDEGAGDEQGVQGEPREPGVLRAGSGVPQEGRLENGWERHVPGGDAHGHLVAAMVLRPAEVLQDSEDIVGEHPGCGAPEGQGADEPGGRESVWGGL
jgi:hypothetical protein